MWSVVWGCLWLWQLKDPLGSIEKSRALCPGPRFLPRPDIALIVCERVAKPDSMEFCYHVYSSAIISMYKFNGDECA